MLIGTSPSSISGTVICIDSTSSMSISISISVQLRLAAIPYLSTLDFSRLIVRLQNG